MRIVSLLASTTEILWAIGAGAGSIGPEWRLADQSMRAAAIEADATRAARIRRNAAACGVPTVGTATGALADYPGLGVGVPVRDPQALADAIRALLDDRSRRDALGRNARQLAADQLSIQTSIARTLALYDRLIERRYRQPFPRAYDIIPLPNRVVLGSLHTGGDGRGVK